MLTDPAYTGPGPVGTMAWLRATVSRFAEGETHARRRALIEARLSTLDPAALRAAATYHPGAEAPGAAIVTVDLTGPAGEGPRACPGAEHALALAAGAIEGAR